MTNNDGPMARAYRQHMRQASNSIIYQEAAPVAKRPAIYEETAPKQLSDYERKSASVADRRPGESDEAYQRRQSFWTRNVQSEDDQANARAHAEQIAMDVMNGRGLDGTHGMFDSSDRAVMRGYVANTRKDGSQVERFGHLASNALTTPGQPSLSMLDRLPRQDGPAVAQRPSIPTSSSGDGWMVGR